MDIPVLVIESDYESAAAGAVTTRIEAFLDLVNQRESRASNTG
jgi:benzoyl-CoA reductase/2-hydroxyglutaryl-CoA dehydratase subunit BcrC/BadD/HgdB